MIRRRHFAALCLAATAPWPLAAMAQPAYPSKPVRVIVGFPPGSTTDVATRVVAEAMGKRLGQPFVVENRPGAASSIAARAAASAPADGYTVFVGSIANTINSAFPGSKTPDIGKEFTPVSLMSDVPNILVAHPSLPVNSVDELIRAAKAKPGAIAFASSGNGTSPHLSGELFSVMADVQMLHVPYKGSSPAVTDLLGGQVQVMFSPASTVLGHIRSGKLKALASTGLKRTAIAPELPTVDELGLKGFETSVWAGFLVPAGTPPDIVARLRAATHEALETPEVQAQYRAQGIEVVKSTSEEFARHIRADTAKWAKVIQSAGIKPE